MKKIFLFVVMLVAFSLQTQAQSGTVEVFSEDGDRFWVIINGQKQNVQPLANVKVPGIKEKWFKMRLIFENEAIPNLDQTVQLVGVDEKWMDVTYAVKKTSKGKYVCRGSAWKESADQGNGVPNTVTTTTKAETPVTNTKTEPVVTKKTTTTTTTPNSNGSTTETTTVKTNTMGVGTNVNVNDDGENVSMNLNIDLNGVDPTMNGNTTVKTTTTTKTTQSGSYQEEQAPATSVKTVTAPPKKSCIAAMSPTDFTSAKQSIVSKKFDDTRLEVANQILKANCVNVSQVIEIMKIFSFEESKLSFAKWAYDKTMDKNNYFKVNDAFAFDASIEELNNYIESHTN